MLRSWRLFSIGWLFTWTLGHGMPHVKRLRRWVGLRNSFGRKLHVTGVPFRMTRLIASRLSEKTMPSGVANCLGDAMERPMRKVVGLCSLGWRSFRTAARWIPCQRIALVGWPSVASFQHGEPRASKCDRTGLGWLGGFGIFHIGKPHVLSWVFWLAGSWRT